MKHLGWLGAVALLAGCSTTKQSSAPTTKAPPEYFKVDSSEAARLGGTVRFEGRAVRGKRITMDAEQACQALHKEPVYEETVITGKSGGLANVFVYVKAGLEGKAFPPAETAVVLEQRGCQFIPRMIGLRAGQPLSVKNSDPVSHNIHPVPKNNRDWNQQQPPEAPDLKRKFAYPEVMIPVKCNIHAWMRSYIGVLDHPFFAVTGLNGTFSLEGLPPGQYVLAAWHEQFGEITQSITLARAGSGTVQFVFR